MSPGTWITESPVRKLLRANWQFLAADGPAPRIDDQCPRNNASSKEVRRYGVTMRRPRSARGKRGLYNPVRVALLLLLAALALAAVIWLAGRRSTEVENSSGIGRFRSIARLWGWQPKQEEAWPETLVVYIFSNTDPEYLNNLNFFLKWGVREGDGAYYIIVVQEGGKSPVSPPKDIYRRSGIGQFLSELSRFSYSAFFSVCSCFILLSYILVLRRYNKNEKVTIRHLLLNPFLHLQIEKRARGLISAFQ